MLVEWTKPNLFTIWGSEGGSEPTLRLIPGMNEVKKDDWDKVSKHPLVKIHLEEDDLIVHDDLGGEEGSEVDGISTLAVKKATKIIKATFDTELLAKWRGEETRSTILTAIDKQVEVVNKSVKVKEKEENDE